MDAFLGANCRATGLPSRSSFSLTTSFSSRVRAHPIWLVVSHRFTSSGWTLRSCLISCMEYTTSPPRLSSPRPTYHGCAGVILTPAPHSTPSTPSSSDSDVTSLTAPPFLWAARGLLAWGLGGCLTRLRILFVSFEETRVTPFASSQSMHVAGRSLRHSYSGRGLPPTAEVMTEVSPGSLLSGTLSSYGASCSRTSDRGRVAEV